MKAYRLLSGSYLQLRETSPNLLAPAESTKADPWPAKAVLAVLRLWPKAPPLAAIEAWTDLERGQAYDWAIRQYLKAIGFHNMRAHLRQRPSFLGPSQ